MPDSDKNNSAHQVAKDDVGRADQPLPNNSAYWHANLRLMCGLLSIWFLVSFGCGILWVDYLNQFHLFGFKLGFWFSQQGAIYAFVILIFVYAWRMNQLDKAYGVDEQE
ncbi:MAG: putative solute:sodium symporter small subunit [Candidatus Pseudothioglobus sp.]